MSDTPRTDLNCLTVETLRTMKGTGTKIVLASVARQLERELTDEQHRIRTLIEQRDSARIQADHKWKLREEFEAVLGTDDVAVGIDRIKQSQRELNAANERINRLEEESESRWHLAQSATGSCAEMSSRIKRLEEAVSIALSNCYDGPMPEYVRKALLEAKEANHE